MSSIRSQISRLMQLPPVPTTQDQRTQSWMTAVADTFKKLLSGQDRLVTARELINSGIAGEGTGGVLVPGTGSGSSVVTVPAAITGLTAIGALDNIFLSWDAPGFANFGYTEVWRASTNDVGGATRIGTTQASVYVDAVGEGATKYYWVRAVSTSGVIGPYQDGGGVQGKTGQDPTYVMSLLTGFSWQANTTYTPFQYVRPTTGNGFQYRCIDGGISAAVEPTWPTTPGNTVVDNGAEWECLEATAHVPFVIGTIDGQPAVAMSGAFIEDATIRNAKIHSLAADKITAGQLLAGEWIQVGGSIWSGYNGYRQDSYGGPAGFWLGLHGGVPRFQMTSAGDPQIGDTPPTFRRFTFDGYDFRLYNIDFLSSADGEFDDLTVDSLYARATGGDTAAYKNYLYPSKKIELSSITDPAEFELYLCHVVPYRRTVSASATGIVASGWAYYNAYGPLEVTTDPLEDIIPFDEPSMNRKRSYEENIGFAIKATVHSPSPSIPYRFAATTSSVWQVDIVDQADVVRLSIYLYRQAVTSGMEFTAHSGDTVVVDVSERIEATAASGGRGGTAAMLEQYDLILSCYDDGGALQYRNGDRLHAVVRGFLYHTASTAEDTAVTGTLDVDFQLVTIPLGQESNEAPLSI